MDCFSLGLWFVYFLARIQLNTLFSLIRLKKNNQTVYCVSNSCSCPNIFHLMVNLLILISLLFFFLSFFLLRSVRLFFVLLSFSTHRNSPRVWQTEWNRHLRRNYHRLRIVIETITMQQIIKRTITQRNSIHIFRCMMMKPMILAISTEMVSKHTHTHILVAQ